MSVVEPAARAPGVIAHRGASGYLPEHTLAAKALAHAQGADYLEQDVVATRDGRLIVNHDLYLERTTDVAEVFPGRAREDGHFYAIDFDWAEIAELTVAGAVDGGRLPRAATPQNTEPYRICTLEQEIELVHELNRSHGRRVGLYPELKHPGWHAEQGVDLSRALLGVLADFGYRCGDDPIFVQCADARELARLRTELGTRLRLTQLVSRRTDSRLLTRDGLRGLAEHAAALGPNYRLTMSADADGRVRARPIAALAREAGLELHPYTFNYRQLPDYAADLETLLAVAYDTLHPEAVFCDFPDLAVHVRARRAPGL